MLRASGYRTVSIAKANRRRDQRANGRCLRVVVGGESYETVDWSLGGFLLPAYLDGAAEGD